MKQIILSHLLDKYESSKHLLEPGVSNRRVMLRIEKKELPEYNYENAAVRDAFNDAAKALETEGLISTQWVTGRPVLSSVVLNLETVMDCYHLIGRKHPRELADTVADLIENQLSGISTSWILRWQQEVCQDARTKLKVPSFCRNDLSALNDLLTVFCEYDALRGEPITMRAFSSKCYHDTKYFERMVREPFLRIAQKYDVELSLLCEEETLGIKDQLAYLGIYARPEIYELSGNASIRTEFGTIDLCATGMNGIGLPSTLVDHVISVDFSKIKKMIFIENKTNYDEYILSESQMDELVVYHGGFLSPQRKKLFAKLGASAPPSCEVFFWADIDLGGFQMYDQLKDIIPRVTPMRMTEQDVISNCSHGLKRSADYLLRLQLSDYYQGESPFKKTIEKIIEYGVTIEQESFL